MTSHQTTFASIAALLALPLGVLVGCAASEPVDVESMSATRWTPTASPIEPAALPTTQSSAPSRRPATRRERATLAHIAFGTERPDVNMKSLGHWSGADAFDGLLPASEHASTVGMLADGRRYEFVGPLDAADPRGTRAHFITYALRFASPAQAAEAYLEIVGSLEGVGRWLPREVTASAALGDESAAFRRIGPEGRESVAHVWRRGDLVLAILGLDDSDKAAVRDTARRMDERAR